MESQLYEIIQQVIANDLKMPVDYLRQKWKGGYNPEKHLFSKDKQGRVVSIWSLEKDTWEMIGHAYTRWMLLNEKNKEMYWIHLFILIQKTYEWDRCDPRFKAWLLRRSEEAFRKIVA